MIYANSQFYNFALQLLGKRPDTVVDFISYFPRYDTVSVFRGPDYVIVAIPYGL